MAGRQLARTQYSEDEFNALFRDYVDPGRGQSTLTIEEQQQLERHSILSSPEALSQEVLGESALRIQREVEHRRERGLSPIPLAVDGYSIQPHETLEQFANRAHLVYEVDPDEDPDELRTRAWEDTHVLNSPFGTMTSEQIQFVQWLFQHWEGMTEPQQNWFQDQVTLARGNQSIDLTALGIGTEVHRRIENSVSRAIQGYVGQPSDRTQLRHTVERAVMEDPELFNNRRIVREAFERMADQIDLGEAIMAGLPRR